MKGTQAAFIAQSLTVILLFILLHGFYTGITTRPDELDSLYYHIPIAKSYLTGDIFTSPKSLILHRFFPGASEGILAIFLLLHIPLNLYNILAITCLFLAAIGLGIRAGLKKEMAVIFAASLVLITGIVRWVNVQVVDVWMAVWYASALALLLKPKAEWKYALLLGSALGMIIGTKYSGPLLAFLLFLFFFKHLLKTFRWYHMVLSAVPVLILGGFWYLRNFIVMGNPLYPLAFMNFPGVAGWALEVPVWKAFLTKPLSMGSAVVSEFFTWPFLIVAGGIISFWKKEGRRLFILTLCNLAVYVLLPNGEGYRVHVSNLRYSYPVFITGLLALYLLAKKWGHSNILMYFAFFQALFSIQVTYHPKLIIVFLPLAYIIWKKTDAFFRG